MYDNENWLSACLDFTNANKKSLWGSRVTGIISDRSRTLLEDGFEIYHSISRTVFIASLTSIMGNSYRILPSFMLFQAGMGFSRRNIR